jgi:hypothetical protein
VNRIRCLWLSKKSIIEQATATPTYPPFSKGSRNPENQNKNKKKSIYFYFSSFALLACLSFICSGFGQEGGGYTAHHLKCGWVGVGLLRWPMDMAHGGEWVIILTIFSSFYFSFGNLNWFE